MILGGSSSDYVMDFYTTAGGPLDIFHRGAPLTLRERLNTLESVLNLRQSFILIVSKVELVSYGIRFDQII